MVLYRSLLVIVFFLIYFPLEAQEKTSLKKLSLEIFSQIQYVSDPQLSPDEQKLAFVVEGFNEDDSNYYSNIWWITFSEEEEELRQITHSKELRYQHPRFSPDQHSLSFLSNRQKENQQIWNLPLKGGEASLAFSFPYDIESFEWASNGKFILFLSKVPQKYRHPTEENESKAKKEQVVLQLKKDGSVWVEAQQLSQDDLNAFLKEVARQNRDSESKHSLQKISLEVEQDTPFSKVVTVLEQCAQVGLWNIQRAPFSATESKEHENSETEKNEDNDSEAEEGTKPWVITRAIFKTDSDGYLENDYQQLFLWDVESDQISQLTFGDADIDKAFFSPDSQKIVLESNRTEEPDGNYNSDLWLIDLATKEMTQLTHDLGYDANPSWSPDGKWIAYINQPPGIYETPCCMIIPAEGGTPKNLTAHLDYFLEEAPKWSADSQSVYLVIPERGEIRLVEVQLDTGESKHIIDGGGDVGAFVVAKKTAMLYAVFTSQQTPAELCEVDLSEKEMTSLTDFNTDLFSDLQLPKTQKITYPSADGTMIEAWVLTPSNFEASQKYPLILSLHGGPIWHFTGAFDFEDHYLASQGYVVVRPNPRGSYGYGYAFCSAINADWGNKDYDDVIAAVDYLIAQGSIDENKMGVGGWSYGGILTNYVITKTTRFKAAVSGASLVDYNSCYGTDDCLREWEMELGPPWRAFELYARISPIRQIAQVKTPTLVLCGEKDYRCPLSQSEQLYIRLKRLKVETALIIYPGESHSIYDMGLYKDKVQRMTLWYDKYVRGLSVNPLKRGLLDKDSE